jgi:hypothetical protein
MAITNEKIRDMENESRKSNVKMIVWKQRKMKFEENNQIYFRRKSP